MASTFRIGFVAVLFGVCLLWQPATAFSEICDLTSKGATCGPPLFNPIGGAIFEQMSEQPTGTGVIDPFLRLQNNPATPGIEQGYNTSDRSYSPSKKMQFDQKEPLNYTHDLKTSAVPIVTRDGKPYREFLLDINEDGSAKGRLLSLDQLQIFQSNTASLNFYDVSTRMLTGASLRYDMDDGSSPDNWIKLDYGLERGSGSGDMIAFIPNERINPALTYLYLFSQFGGNFVADSGIPSDAGFEEWWVRPAALPPPPSHVPEPHLLAMFGLGLFLVAARFRRAKGQKSH